MFWVVLAVAHRKLRMEHQRKLLLEQDSNNNNEATPSSSLLWQEEPKEQLKDLMEEAVSHLDEKTDIGDMSLRQLRYEIQSFLEPQIMQLLNTAHDVDGEMNEEDGDYIFSQEESKEYKEILRREYENVCQLLKDSEGKHNDQQKSRTSDPVPFYKIKKDAIETLLTYFDWWPGDSTIIAPTINNSTADTNEGDDVHVDEFGFSPNESDSEIVVGMRYYHVRNLVRSSLVRRSPDKATGNDDNTEPSHHGYYSLLPFKSTIPSAGRGVYVDGFAPAGTLLALFPGKVWPKEHLQSASLQTQMQFSQNDPRHQLSMRYDDILIDSRQSPYTVVQNLWALGHIFNHPPAPTTASSATPVDQLLSEKEKDESDNNTTNHSPLQGPNCVTVPINFTERMLGEDLDKLRDYIPNEYEVPPKPWAKDAFEKDEIIMHGMGLVALRDVKDEELFYDYRLSPDEDDEVQGGKDGQYPSWYYVWDEKAISNRWSTDKDS